jgi:hypothetical protein
MCMWWLAVGGRGEDSCVSDDDNLADCGDTLDGGSANFGWTGGPTNNGGPVNGNHGGSSDCGSSKCYGDPANAGESTKFGATCSCGCKTIAGSASNRETERTGRTTEDNAADVKFWYGQCWRSIEGRYQTGTKIRDGAVESSRETFRRLIFEQRVQGAGFAGFGRSAWELLVLEQLRCRGNPGRI